MTSEAPIGSIATTKDHSTLAARTNDKMRRRPVLGSLISSSALLKISLALLWLCMYSADNKRRVKDRTQLQMLYEQVCAVEDEDKVKGQPT